MGLFDYTINHDKDKKEFTFSVTFSYSDLERRYKQFNDSEYPFEEIMPQLVELAARRATSFGVYGYFENDRLCKEDMQTAIWNTGFRKEDFVIVKTDKEQPIDENSVVRLY